MSCVCFDRDSLELLFDTVITVIFDQVSPFRQFLEWESMRAYLYCELGCSQINDFSTPSDSFYVSTRLLHKGTVDTHKKICD